MSSENDGIGGEEWIGEKVETWWGTTSQWKTGEVVEYKALRDEYKVRYDEKENGEHWEQLDSLFRFKEQAKEEQKQELLRQQEADISSVTESITEEQDMDSWAKKFIRKIYCFLGRDPDQVLEFLDPNLKVIDQMPQLIRTQPFPVAQKLSSLRSVVRDDTLFAKISKVLSEENSYPLVARRRNGHSRERPKSSKTRTIIQSRLSEHMDDSVSNGITPDVTPSSPREGSVSTKKHQREESEEDEDLPPRKRMRTMDNNSSNSSVTNQPEAQEPGTNDKDVSSSSALGDTYEESIESLNFVRQLARASGRRTNASHWAPHFVKQQQKLFNAYNHGQQTPKSPRALRTQESETSSKEPKKRGRKKKQVTKESNKEAEQNLTKPTPEEVPDKKVEEVKPEPPKRKRGRPRKIRPNEVVKKDEPKPESEEKNSASTATTTQQSEAKIPIKEKVIEDVDVKSPKVELKFKSSPKTTDDDDSSGISSDESSEEPPQIIPFSLRRLSRILRHSSQVSEKIVPYAASHREIKLELDFESLLSNGERQSEKEPERKELTQSPHSATNEGRSPGSEIADKLRVQVADKGQSSLGNDSVEPVVENNPDLNRFSTLRKSRDDHAREENFDDKFKRTLIEQEVKDNKQTVKPEKLTDSVQKRKRKNNFQLDFGMDHDAPADKKRRLDSALRKSSVLPSNQHSLFHTNTDPESETGHNSSHFSFDNPETDTRDDDVSGENSKNSFQSCLSAAKSMAPAKKIWVLHNFRNVERSDGQFWDFYLGQGPKLTLKRSVSLVTITEHSTCTCSQFKKNKLCSHLLFTLVCVLGVNEDSPILQKSTVSNEELKTIFDGAPKDSRQLPRLAPNQMVRAFHAWFDSHISEANRRSVWESMCTEEEKSSHNVHKQ